MKDEEIINISKGSKRSIFLKLRTNLKEPCNSCKFKWICGGCRAVAYYSTGDFHEKDPLCFLYHPKK